MKEEIAAAVVFLARLVKQTNSIDKSIVEQFSNELTTALVDRFKNHWYEQEPMKGQAYRCIRITETEPVDPVLARVVTLCGLKLPELGLPTEFTLWIDPQNVTCRFGESMGTTYYTVAALTNDGRLDNHAHSLDVGEMVRSDHIRKSNELSRLQESARRRRNHHHNHHNSSHHHHHHHHHYHSKPVKKYAFYAPGRRVSPTEPWYNAPVAGASPLHHTAHNAAAAALTAAKDRFHWVRNDQELVAA